jgi:hypothetical protein
MPRSKETNIQFIKRIMSFSPVGPFAQVFVLEAVARFAQLVATSPPTTAAGNMINGAMWQQTAEWMGKEIETHFQAVAGSGQETTLTLEESEAILLTAETLHGSLLAYKQCDIHSHDWEEHAAALARLIKAFPDLTQDLTERYHIPPLDEES